MDPVTIGLLGGSLFSNFMSSSRAQDASEAALAWQQQRAAEQDRFAQAARTDAYGNRVSYDKALNEWITQLTPTQKALMLSGEREQRLGLTVDAERNRAARGRLARAGEMAQPGFDEAMAGYRFGKPRNEAATRGDLATLIASSKPQRGGAGFEELRGNVPPTGGGGAEPSGVNSLADTLMKARTQGMTESAARSAKHTSEYGPAIDRYLAMQGGGGNAPISMPTTGASTDATQNAMAQLMATVGAQGAANVGGAQKTDVAAQGMPLFDARGSAALIQAMNRYNNPTGAGKAAKAGTAGVGGAGGGGAGSYGASSIYRDDSTPNWYSADSMFGGNPNYYY